MAHQHLTLSERERIAHLVAAGESCERSAVRWRGPQARFRLSCVEIGNEAASTRPIWPKTSAGYDAAWPTKVATSQEKYGR